MEQPPAGITVSDAKFLPMAAHGAYHAAEPQGDGDDGARLGKAKDHSAYDLDDDAGVPSGDGGRGRWASVSGKALEACST